MAIPSGDAGSDRLELMAAGTSQAEQIRSVWRDHMGACRFAYYAVMTAGAVGILSACVASPPGAMPAGATNSVRPLAGSKTFYYTGNEQRFNVPYGVTKLTVVARGAAGDGEKIGREEYFGRGGRVDAEIHVKPGATLYVFVGGRGSENGGFNGGGNPGSDPSGPGGYGGGGASDIRSGGDSLSERIVIAGGGGGEGFGTYDRSSLGGKGGGAEGGAGSGYYGGGGGGGTQSYGGAGGAGDQGSDGSGASGQAGNFGVGGSGGNGGYNPDPSGYNQGGGGGGGGGGYYGGGGGGGGRAEYASIYGTAGGGGGGGSSYVERTAIKFHTWSGWKNATGNGLIVLSWQ